MNPEVNETNIEQAPDGMNLSTDDLAAAMGYITTVGGQSMQMEQAAQEEQMTQEQPQEMSQEQPPEPQVDPEAMKSEIVEGVVSELKKEMKGLIRSEIKKLIDEEDGTEDETTKDTE